MAGMPQGFLKVASEKLAILQAEKAKADERKAIAEAK